LGYPMGGPGQSRHFYLQWHFENTDGDKNVREDAGLRLHFTQVYRPIEFGTYGLGPPAIPAGLAVPPRSKRLSMQYLCRKDWINALIGQNSEITVFAYLPHTHNAGVSLFSTIVRNGAEVEYVANNQYYNNHFQYINYLQNPVKIRRGDELLLSCVYNSEYTDKFILGGLGTSEEMWYVCLQRLLVIMINLNLNFQKFFWG